MERVLTLRELNRATLARQLLLRRERLPVPRAVERLCALQAQYSPAPYIGLWSRLAGFRRDRLTRALERGEVVKASLFRVTLHLVSAADYPAFAGLLVGSRRAKLARRAPEFDLEELERQLQERESWTLPAVRDLVYPPLREATTGWLDQWSATRALFPLVHVPPSGTWRFHGEATVMHAARRLGCSLQPEGAAERLVRSFLAANGPATQDDVLKFTGLQVGPLKAGLASQELVRHRDEDERVLLDLPGLPLPKADTRAPARFLTKWDSAVVPYSDRRRIVAPEHQPEVIKRNGDFLPTFLVDGFVAGTWEVARSRERATLTLRSFAPLPRSRRTELAAEGERLVRFVEDDATRFSVRFARA